MPIDNQNVSDAVSVNEKISIFVPVIIIIGGQDNTVFTDRQSNGGVVPATVHFPRLVYQSRADAVTVATAIAQSKNGVSKSMTVSDSVFALDFMPMVLSTATKHYGITEGIRVYAGFPLHGMEWEIIRGTPGATSDSLAVRENIAATILRSTHQTVWKFVNDWVGLTESNRDKFLTPVVRLDAVSVRETIMARIQTGTSNVLLLSFVEQIGVNDFAILALFNGRVREHIFVSELQTAARQATSVNTWLQSITASVAVAEAISTIDIFSTGQGARLGEKITARIDPRRGPRDAVALTETIIPIIQKKALATGATGIGSQQSANQNIRGDALAYYTGLVVPTDVTFSTGSHSITLRKPEFGDQDEYGVVRIQQETRDRDLVIFQDPIWPTTEKLMMEFKWLNETVSQALITYLEATVGQRTTYHDYLGRSWIGFITNPDTAVQQAGLKNFTAKIEFQIIEA